MEWRLLLSVLRFLVRLWAVVQQHAAPALLKGAPLRLIELAWASLMFDVWLISRFGR